MRSAAIGRSLVTLVSDGAEEAILIGPRWQDREQRRIALGFGDGTVAFADTGIAAGKDGDATLAVDASTLSIGANHAGAAEITGIVHALTVYPTVVRERDLATLSVVATPSGD